jgi:hypothetical protein
VIVTAPRGTGVGRDGGGTRGAKSRSGALTRIACGVGAGTARSGASFAAFVRVSVFVSFEVEAVTAAGRRRPIPSRK